jgi:IclR family pca regulon transcriptional regulator
MARLQPSDAEKRRDSDYGPDFLESLARGLKIMTAFDAERRQMSLSDIARIVGLPRATVRRALHTLNCLGYLETDGRLFRLTPRILTLAAAYLTSNAVSVVLQPMCERLCREVGESCTAGVLDGAEIVMVARAVPSQLLAVGAGIGYRIPAFCSALGRVLLGALDDEALDDYLDRLEPAAVTEHTVTDKRRLRELILRAREQGFALGDQEVELGFRSVAVPVKRFDGTTIVAMNIGARVEQASTETLMGVYLPRLIAAAKDLTGELI